MSNVILSTYYNNLLIPTVSLFADGTEVILDSGTTITESATIPGQFSFTSGRDGLHGIIMYTSGNFLGTFWADIPTTGSVVATESRLESLALPKVRFGSSEGMATYEQVANINLTPSISIPVTTVQASQTEDLISIYRGDTLRVSFTSLGDISSRDKLWFTLKRNLKDLDSESIVQIVENSGLTVFSGSTAYSSGLATLTVSSPTDATIDMYISEDLTSQLSNSHGLLWDMQVLETTGIRTFVSGKCNVVNDVTRATE